MRKGKWIRRRLGGPAIWAVVALVLTAGCNTVNVYSPNGGVTVARWFGIIHIDVPKDAPYTIVRTLGTGLIVSNRQFTLGYLSETAVWIDPTKCQLTLLIPTQEDAERVLQMVAQPDGLLTPCAISLGDK